MHNIKTVAEWYNNERSYADMPVGNINGLKIWEKNVISTYFPSNARILNIGCGMGREAFCLYDMGFKIVAVDISLPVITEAKRIAQESKRSIEFILINGLDLPFESDSFDIAIIWSQTYGLLYGDENKLHVLRECKRILKKDGILSFSGHDREYQQENYSQYLKDNRFFAYEDTDCYWESFTINEIQDCAKRVGFTIVNCKRGRVSENDDGTILYCTCRNQK